MRKIKDKIQTAKDIFLAESELLAKNKSPQLMTEKRFNAAVDSFECLFIEVDDITSNDCVQSPQLGSKPLDVALQSLDKQYSYNVDSFNYVDFMETYNLGSVHALHACFELCKEHFPEKRTGYKVIYPTYLVAFIIMFAGILGYKTSRQIAKFYKDNKLELLLLVPEMPPADCNITKSTIAEVRTQVDALALSRLFAKTLGSCRIELEELITYNPDKYTHNRYKLLRTIGFDGQEMKSTSRKGEKSRRRKGGVITVVYDCTCRTVIAYRVARAKNQETQCFLDCVRSGEVDVKDCIVMCDALNTSTIVTSVIATFGGYFMMPVKRNHCRKLNAELKGIFKLASDDAKSAEFTDKDHGRIESTKIDVLPAHDYLDQLEHNKHQDVNTLVRYTKTVTHLNAENEEDTVTVNVRYYISNLEYDGEKTAQQCLASILDYWMVETHHYTLDTTSIDQDSFQAHNPNTIGCMAFMNKCRYNFATVIRNALSKLRSSNNPESYEDTFAFIKRLRIIDFIKLLPQAVPALSITN